MNEDSSNLSKAPLEAIRYLAESVLSAECAMPLGSEYPLYHDVSYIYHDVFHHIPCTSASLDTNAIPGASWKMFPGRCRHVIPGEAQVE